MTNEEFLKDVCPSHTEKSKWNRGELLHILEKHKEAINFTHCCEELCECAEPDYYEDERKLNELNIGGVSGGYLIEIENAYIEDADTVNNYDVTGRVSKLWVTKEDFDQIKCINN